MASPKFPAAKVIWRISKGKPKITPIVPVIPNKIPKITPSSLFFGLLPKSSFKNSVNSDKES